MKKIKIAQIGTSANSHGNNIFNSLRKNDDIFEIAGFVLPENEREKFPEKMLDFEGYKELTLEEVFLKLTTGDLYGGAEKIEQKFDRMSKGGNI